MLVRSVQIWALLPLDPESTVNISFSKKANSLQFYIPFLSKLLLCSDVYYRKPCGIGWNVYFCLRYRPSHMLSLLLGTACFVAISVSNVLVLFVILAPQYQASLTPARNLASSFSVLDSPFALCYLHWLRRVECETAISDRTRLTAYSDGHSEWNHVMRTVRYAKSYKFG